MERAERESLYQELIEPGPESTRLERMDNAELTRVVVARFRDTLPDPKRVSLNNLSLSLSILRQSRDKTIPHNEAIKPSALQIPTWGEAISLANYARELVASLGAGYSGLLFGEGSKNYLLINE